MRLELRPRLMEDHSARIQHLVLVSESEEESKTLDQVFGDKVDADGLIARGRLEVRLSDGFREHYLYVEPEWTPCGMKLPSPGRYAVIYKTRGGRHDRFIGDYVNDEHGGRWTNLPADVEITHWSPLPEMPK